MSTVYNNKTNDDSTIHCTNYDDDGRHSIDYDPVTGDVTHDHTVSNENQDYKEQWLDSNFWKDLDKDDEDAQKEKDKLLSDNEYNNEEY